jgi:hypothetical protein
LSQDVVSDDEHPLRVRCGRQAGGYRLLDAMQNRSRRGAASSCRAA